MADNTSDKSKKRSIPQKDVKLLWGLAAARCCYPQCRTVCVVDATSQDRAVTIGKIAHIVAHSDEGPRANPAMPIDERNQYENLVLLCGNHHDEVDGQDNTFNVQTLRQWKSAHEQWVRSMLTEAIPDVTSAELEVVCSALLTNPMASDDQLSVIPPKEKMARNNLTDRITYLLRIGMAASVEVSGFLREMSAIDVEFAERLKAGFVEKYNELKAAGYEGDSLFEAMAEAVGGGYADLRKNAAAVAVLTYMFEACEVFER